VRETSCGVNVKTIGLMAAKGYRGQNADVSIPVQTLAHRT